jgi:adenylate kinase family enzyme
VGRDIIAAVRKVAVIGSGGAGKSTFARRLGEQTGLPVVHLDQLYWHPGWVETPGEAWRELQRNLVEGEAWILDGNYGATLDIRLSAAETVVFFDFPRALCVRRAAWRSIRHRGQSIQASDCPERLNGEFLRWVWSYPTNSRPRAVEAMNRHARQAEIFVLRRPRDADQLLHDFAQRQ